MKKDELSPEHKVLRAMMLINRRDGGTPFFSYLLCRLETVEAPWLPYKTLATDGEKIYWHRDWVSAHNVKEIAFGMCHEVLHLVLQHFGRRGSRDRDRWGQAIDHELNLTLIDHQVHARCMTPPANILADPQYKGMVAEKIYSLLPAGCDDQPMDFHFDLSDLEKGAMQGQGKNKGMKIPVLADPNSPAMVSRWQQRLQEAAERATRERGHLPGNIAEIVDALKKPTIPWQRFLQDWVCTILSRDDYNWNIFNSMYIAEYDMYLPGLRSETIGDVAMIIDTSGSVGSEALSQFLSEVLNIRQNYGIENLHVIQCDHGIQNHTVYSQHDHIDPKEIKIHGRGGTDLRIGFEFIEQENINPEFVCVFTDGETPWPEKRTHYPTLAALTKHHSTAPDWMDSFVLNV